MGGVSPAVPAQKAKCRDREEAWQNENLQSQNEKVVHDSHPFNLENRP